jgi:hypothetical protein
MRFSGLNRVRVGGKRVSHLPYTREKSAFGPDTSTKRVCKSLKSTQYQYLPGMKKTPQKPDTRTRLYMRRAYL